MHCCKDWQKVQREEEEFQGQKISSLGKFMKSPKMLQLFIVGKIDEKSNNT